MLRLVRLLVVMHGCRWRRRDALIRTTGHDRRWIRSTWWKFRSDMTSGVFQTNARRDTFDGLVLFGIVAIRAGIVVFLIEENSIPTRETSFVLPPFQDTIPLLYPVEIEHSECVRWNTLETYRCSSLDLVTDNKDSSFEHCCRIAREISNFVMRRILIKTYSLLIVREANAPLVTNDVWHRHRPSRSDGLSHSYKAS